MQAFGVRGAERVDHGIPSKLDAHGIDHQVLTFITADGIPVPGRPHLCRMRHIHPHLSKLMIERIEDRDFVWPLDNLHAKREGNKRQSFGPTLVAGRWIAFAGQRNLAEFLHHFRRPGLQDRIGVIADQLKIITNASLRSLAQARPVPDRAGARQRWLQSVERCVGPYTREFRKGHGAFVSRRVLRQGRNYRGVRQDAGDREGHSQHRRDFPCQRPVVCTRPRATLRRWRRGRTERSLHDGPLKVK